MSSTRIRWLPLQATKLLLTIGLGAVILACSSKPPAKPTEMDLKLEASATINPDQHGRASPVVVRVYQLKSLNAFNSADFFSLYEHDQDVLGADLISKEEFQFIPGDKKQVTHPVPPDMCCIAVFAAYRDLEHARWRATANQFKPNEVNQYLIKLDGKTVSITVPPEPEKPKQEDVKKEHAETPASTGPITAE